MSKIKFGLLAAAMVMAASSVHAWELYDYNGHTVVLTNSNHSHSWTTQEGWKKTGRTILGVYYSPVYWLRYLADGQALANRTCNSGGENKRAVFQSDKWVSGGQKALFICVPNKVGAKWK